jgi:hypothetical protein
MIRRKAFLIVQALFCALTAGLLAAGALSLYADGAANQAAGDLFYPMFTRERAGAWLLPILPLFLCSLGLTAAGLILGIRDENAEKPLEDERLPRDFRRLGEKAARRQAEGKTLILRTAVLLLSLFLIAAGILNGGLEDVLAKGISICTECIGLG